MKLMTSVRQIREANKSFSGLEIKAKEEDCTTADAKGIIQLV